MTNNVFIEMALSLYRHGFSYRQIAKFADVDEKMAYDIVIGEIKPTPMFGTPNERELK